jgi:hypothetical protein
MVTLSTVVLLISNHPVYRLRLGPDASRALTIDENPNREQRASYLV